MKKFNSGIIFLILITGCQPANSPTNENHPDPIEVGEESTIDVISLKKMMDDQQIVNLLDVRHPEEIADGTIPGVKKFAEFGADEFDQQLSLLNKDSTYYVYCFRGGRSSNTVQYMKSMGFKNVFNIEGGLEAWKKEGYSLENPK